VWVSVTFAPTTTASVGSVTVPRIVPLTACAEIDGVMNMTARLNNVSEKRAVDKVALRLFIISSLLRF
jgi:hypothetical protein